MLWAGVDFRWRSCRASFSHPEKGGSVEVTGRQRLLPQWEWWLLWKEKGKSQRDILSYLTDAKGPGNNCSTEENVLQSGLWVCFAAFGHRFSSQSGAGVTAEGLWCMSVRSQAVQRALSGQQRLSSRFEIPWKTACACICLAGRAE